MPNVTVKKICNSKFHEILSNPDVMRNIVCDFWSTSWFYISLDEQHHEKTGFLPMQKQRRRSASQSLRS